MKIWNDLWWKFMPGTEFNVKWPTGPVEKSGDWAASLTESADPNDHYRWALEMTVGKQGWDWDWKIGNVTDYKDTLRIKIRRGKDKFAPFFALKWS